VSERISSKKSNSGTTGLSYTRARKRYGRTKKSPEKTEGNKPSSEFALDKVSAGMGKSGGGDSPAVTLPSSPAASELT